MERVTFVSLKKRLIESESKAKHRSQWCACGARGMRCVLKASRMLAVAITGLVAAGGRATPCLFGARVCLVGRIGLRCFGRGAGGERALLCAGSIGRACDSGMFTATQLEYMRASRESCDARDVSWHRAVTRLVDTHGPDRVRNNAIMHALEDLDDFEGAVTLNETARKGRGRRRGRRRL